MKRLRGVLQILIGVMQVGGTILYVYLVVATGFREQTHLVGGFLVLITFLGLAMFDWPRRREP